MDRFGRVGTIRADNINCVDRSRWSSKDWAAARDILSYLTERPKARDSLTAIADWWIRRHRLEEAVRTVAGVVERLVEEALLVEYTDPPGYGVNEQRLGEVAELIRTQAP